MQRIFRNQGRLWPRPSAAVAFVTLLTAIGCSLQGHNRGTPEGRWGHPGRSKGANDGATRLAAFEAPPFEPEKLGESPPTLDPAPGIGASPGSFAVTDDGVATYTIPIEVPPARAGLQPSLALSYSSTAGNGVTGVGFSLAGLSAISRCGQNLRDDGNVQGVRLNGDDKFCLDGRRLVAVAGAYGAHDTEYRTVPDSFVKVVSHGGSVDAASYTGPQSFTVYTKDGRILDYGATDDARVFVGAVTKSWALNKTSDRAGNTMKVLYTATTATAAVPGLGDVSYVESHYPFRIIYGANDHGAPDHALVDFGLEDRPDVLEGYGNGVKTRIAKRLAYVAVTAGGDGHTNFRSYNLDYTNAGTGGRSKLEHVTECVGTVCKRPTTFRWGLGQQGFGPRKVLTTPPPPLGPEGISNVVVMDVNGDGRDDFVYPDHTGWNIAFHGQAPDASPYAGVVRASAPNDAFTDIFGDDYTLWQRGLVFDYEGDGRSDLLLTDDRPTWHLLHSTGNDLELVDTQLPRASLLVVNNAFQGQGVGVYLADLNGDGARDLVEHWGWTDDPSKPHACIQGNADFPACRWRYRLSTGSGFSPELHNIPAMADVSGDEVIVLDVDGDGKDELLALPLGGNTNLNYNLFRWQNGDFLPPTDSGLGYEVHNEARTLVDVNGDGLKDLVASNDTEHPFPPYPDLSLQLTLWINTGHGFRFGKAAVEGPPTVPGFNGEPFFVPRQMLSMALTLDYDGDGREGVLVPYPRAEAPIWPNHLEFGKLDRWLLMRAAGDRFVVEDVGLPYEPKGSAYHSDYWYNCQGPRIVDEDGDGRQDFLTLSTDKEFVLYTRAGEPLTTDLLSEVIEGGIDVESQPGSPANELASVRVTYRPLLETADGFYKAHAKDNTPCDFPCRRVIGPRPVVSSHSVDGSQQAGGTPNVNDAVRYRHSYREARTDQWGRGWLGFRTHEVEVTDLLKDTFEQLRTSHTSHTTYDNITYDAAARSFPYAQKPSFRFTYGYEPCAEGVGGSCRWLTTDTTRWHVRPTAGGATHFVYSTHESHDEYSNVEPDLGWQEALDVIDVFQAQPFTFPFQWATIDRDAVDEFGNARLETMRQSPVSPDDFNLAAVTTVDTEYINQPENNWLIGLVYERVVREEAAGIAHERRVKNVYNLETGLLTRTTTATPDDVDHWLDTRLGRDVYGNVTHVAATDAFDNVREASITYEPGGRFPHAFRNALGHTTYVKLHSGLGLPTVAVDERGQRTTWQYDGFGVLRRETQPDGTFTDHWLTRERMGDEWVRTLHVQTSTGEYDEQRFDRLGRPLLMRARSLGGEELEVRQAHTWFGAPSEQTLSARVGAAPAGSVAFTYDSRLRPLRTTFADGTYVERSYLGPVSHFFDARGNASYVVENGRGQVIESRDEAGEPTFFTYGPFGTLIRSVDPKGHATTQTYDAYGRLLEQRDPDRGAHTMRYDAFGDLRYEDDALGRQSFFDYDAIGRLAHKGVFAQGGTERLGNTEYGYDVGEGNATGQPTSMYFEDPSSGDWHRLVYRYDALGRLAKLDNVLPSHDTGVAERFRILFGYDGQGRLGSTTYPPVPGQAVPYRINYAYDAANHLRSVVEAASGKALWTAEEADEAGRLTLEAFGNGAHLRSEYHPRNGLLLNLIVHGSAEQGGPTLGGHFYEYDANGNVTERGQTGLGSQAQYETFTYDERNRLTTGSRKGEATLRYEYRYDALGNLTYKSDVGTYEYDPVRPHVLLRANAQAYAHDALGRQTRRPGNVEVTYNAFDLPSRLTQNGVEQARFAYDGRGHRVRKVTDTGVITYAADLYERHQKEDGTVEHRMRVHAAGRPVAEAVFAGGATEPTRRYLHADALGSTTLVTGEGATGPVVLERRSYDPFGVPRHPDWSSDAPAPPVGPTGASVGFTGHEDDRELGLVNMKGRAYDPRLGRFLTPDPVVQAPLLSASWNRYSYVWNNPLTHTDPTGFEVEEPVGLNLPTGWQPVPGMPGWLMGPPEDVVKPPTKSTSTHEASSAGHAEAPTNGSAAPSGSDARNEATSANDPAGQFFQQLSHDLDRQIYFYSRVGAASAAVGATGGAASAGLFGAVGEAGLGLLARAPGAVQAINNLVAGAIEGVAPGALGGGLTPALAGAGTMAAGERALGRAEGGGGRMLGRVGEWLRSLSRGGGSKNPVDAARAIATSLPDEVKCFAMCRQFAEGLQEGLSKKGISGTLIKIDVGKSMSVYSDSLGPLGTRDLGHWAVQVGDTVFDNLRPGGIPYAHFYEDLGGASLDFAQRAGSVRITRTPF